MEVPEDALKYLAALGWIFIGAVIGAVIGTVTGGTAEGVIGAGTGGGAGCIFSVTVYNLYYSAGRKFRDRFFGKGLNAVMAVGLVVFAGIVVGIECVGAIYDMLCALFSICAQLARSLRTLARPHRDRPGPVASGSPAVANWNLCLISRLMPAQTGRRWLAEADSVLFEIEPQDRPTVTRNYLLTAPRVIAAAWTHTALTSTRRARQ
jgi:hypothetical protein